MEISEKNHKLLLRDRDNHNKKPNENKNENLKKFREELSIIQQLFKEIDFSVFNIKSDKKWDVRGDEDYKNIEKNLTTKEKTNFGEDISSFSSLSTTDSSILSKSSLLSSSITLSSLTSSTSSLMTSSSSFSGKRNRDSCEIDISNKVYNSTIKITNYNDDNKSFHDQFSSTSSLSSNPKNEFSIQNGPTNIQFPSVLKNFENDPSDINNNKNENGNNKMPKLYCLDYFNNKQNQKIGDEHINQSIDQNSRYMTQSGTVLCKQDWDF